MFDIINILVRETAWEVIESIKSYCNKGEIQELNTELVYIHNKCPTCYCELCLDKIKERRGDNPLFDEIMTVLKCPNGHYQQEE